MKQNKIIIEMFIQLKVILESGNTYVVHSYDKGVWFLKHHYCSIRNLSLSFYCYVFVCVFSAREFLSFFFILSFIS